MTDVFCSVKSCKYRNFAGICDKSEISVKEKDIESQSILWTEKICDDFREI